MSLFNNAIIGAAGQQGYKISRSVRFRASATAYFNRTPAATGNRKTWTWSAWVKRGTLTVQNFLFSAYTAASDSGAFNLYFSSGDALVCAGGTTNWRITTQLFRDPAAWYHIVVAMDTTQATAANRLLLYVNGVQVTAYTGTDPTLNLDTAIDSAILHTIAKNASAGTYLDGYLAEVNFVDGQALTPSSFGETNTITGVWQPKKYAGTYGTNGFYLNFSDNSNNTAATIGKDYSGNGNNWTPTNISVTAGVTYDSMIDVPTLYADGGNGRGNYCTLNPLTSTNSITVNNANLDAGASSASGNVIRSTLMNNTGKWYFEAAVTFSSVGFAAIGVVLDSQSIVSPTSLASVPAGMWLWRNDAQKVNNGTGTAYGTSASSGDIIMVAYDADAGKIWFGKQGTWFASGDPSAGTNEAFSGLTKSIGPCVNFQGTVGSSTFVCNFGQRPFTYTPPTGFKALNTQNLPDATVKKGNAHFDVVTSTATVSTGTTVSSLAFSPGLMWRKNRNNVESHYWIDAVRGTGAGGFLVSNSTAAATGYPNSDGTLTFDSNGYTITETNWNSGEFYFNGRTYVDWHWNAGSSTVTDTSGTISSQVRANATAGFSIVTYTGTGVAATIGHGLGVAPRMIIIFERSPGGDDHIVYHASLTSNSYSIRLNTTAAQAGPSGAYWNSTSPTSSVFSVGTSGESNQSTATYVAYCFAPVAGYSAFGGYTGNGSADGPFVFTGFRPRFVMVRAFSTGLRDWLIYDTSASNPNNPGSDGPLIASGTDVTSYDGVAYTSVDILSNGFKIRVATTNLNASGESHLFMAFAENPFKHSLAR